MSGNFLFKVSGRAHKKIAEVIAREAKRANGNRGDICCASNGVKGVKILPTRPTTEQILKNLCRRFVGKISMVKM